MTTILEQQLLTNAPHIFTTAVYDNDIETVRKVLRHDPSFDGETEMIGERYIHIDSYMTSRAIHSSINKGNWEMAAMILEVARSKLSVHELESMGCLTTIAIANGATSPAARECLDYISDYMRRTQGATNAGSFYMLVSRAADPADLAKNRHLSDEWQAAKAEYFKKHPGIRPQLKESAKTPTTLQDWKAKKGITP